LHDVNSRTNGIFNILDICLQIQSSKEETVKLIFNTQRTEEKHIETSVYNGVLLTTFAPSVTGRHKMLAVRASTVPDREST
jgi:hypothetical protein